ncbi:MAG: site-specific integrase [Candidatus Heimdallarchaeota archaeon]
MSEWYPFQEDFNIWWQLQNYSSVSLYNFNHFLRQLNRLASLTDIEAVKKVMANQDLRNRVNLVGSYRSYARFMKAERKITREELAYILDHIKKGRYRGNNSTEREKWAVPKEFWNDLVNKTHHKVAAMAMWLGFNFGLRRSEIMHLRVKDIDFENEIIWIRSHKANKRTNQVAWRPKHLRSREIPFSYEQKKVLEQWLNIRPELDHPYLLWISWANQNTRLKADILNRWFKKIKYQGKHLTPHILRYSFASHYYFKVGMKLKTLALMIGHANVAVTSDYLQIDKKEGFAEARALMAA